MRLRITMVALAVMLVGVILASGVALPGKSRPAATEGVLPMAVNGYVWDSGHVPLVGAEVNVSLKTPGDSLRSYSETTTDSAGYYQTVFGADDWENGDTILVVAEYDGDTVSNSTTATTGVALYSVNVTMTITIPEFGHLGSLVPVAGVMGIFMMVFFARKRTET